MPEEQNTGQENTTAYRGAATDAALAIDAATLALLAAPKVKEVYDKVSRPESVRDRAPDRLQAPRRLTRAGGSI